MEVGAVSGIDTEETDELYATKTSWLGRGVQKSHSHFEFPLESKTFSHTEEPALTKRNISIRPMMSRPTKYDFDLEANGYTDWDGNPRIDFKVSARFSNRDDRTESRNKDRDYSRGENRERDYERYNEMENRAERE